MHLIQLALQNIIQSNEKTKHLRNPKESLTVESRLDCRVLFFLLSCSYGLMKTKMANKKEGFSKTRFTK